MTSLVLFPAFSNQMSLPPKKVLGLSFKSKLNGMNITILGVDAWFS